MLPQVLDLVIRRLGVCCYSPLKSELSVLSYRFVGPAGGGRDESRLSRRMRRESILLGGPQINTKRCRCK